MSLKNKKPEKRDKADLLIDIYATKDGGTLLFDRDLVASKIVSPGTVRKVAKYIILKQRDFFNFNKESGNRKMLLKQMILEDIASELGIVASTVSRAISGSVIQLPNGDTIKLSDLVVSKDGLLQIATQDVITNVVRQEQIRLPQFPMNDDEMAKYLFKNHNIKVARRTVAKYRNILGIEPARQRMMAYRIKRLIFKDRN